MHQGHGELSEQHRVGVIGQSRTDGAMRWIGKALTLLQEGASGNKLPEVAAGHPLRTAALPLHRDIVPRLTDFFQLLRNCFEAIAIYEASAPNIARVLGQ